MPNVSLVDIGKLSKPATVLVEKISSAIGIVYEPRRIKQKAIAEAEASKTKALMDLEIEDIQKRALNRLVTEEIRKQENIENITEKSFSSLEENATPENIENDWLSNFFDKCKLISDNEMQDLWAKILAGESNIPGTFSKRTIEFISTLDKSDALLFDNFLKYCWYIGGYQPLIIDYNDNTIYENNNITFSNLMHLDEIGLISFNPTSGFIKIFNSDEFSIGYYGRILNLNFKNIPKKELKTGSVVLTKIGLDLAQVNHPNIYKRTNDKNEYSDDFYHYIVEKFFKATVILSEPLSNKVYNKTE
ncbi:MAG: hypothetical protein DRQ78_10325 [Epsilonproteobacteria bacterium]|nr:MAG: hypothetical protein DRQ78_10325 [Campylobacterota bacterium]